jgi:peptidoglycan DL-endopeptidase CwlO
MPGKHRRVIPRRRRSAVTVTSAALAAGGLLAGSGSAVLGINAKTFAAPSLPKHTAAITLIVLAAPPVLPAQVSTVKSAALPVTPTNIPVKPSTATRAVTSALAQQGTPYVYGGNAPGGFDCSGLVQWIYKKVGITLPRTAATQATTGRRVSLSELQPGDLLFFYRPVGARRHLRWEWKDCRSFPTRPASPCPAPLSQRLRRGTPDCLRACW